MRTRSEPAGPAPRKDPRSKLRGIWPNQHQLSLPAVSSPFCRSLLAGDSKRAPTDLILNRLQAGSYLSNQPKQASGYETHRKATNPGTSSAWFAMAPETIHLARGCDFWAAFQSQIVFSPDRLQLWGRCRPHPARPRRAGAEPGGADHSSIGIHALEPWFRNRFASGRSNPLRSATSIARNNPQRSARAFWLSRLIHAGAKPY